MISKTMVCAFYKATAIYADTEAEQTYCQSDDGNDILCLMLTQVSECYFEIMEVHKNSAYPHMDSILTRSLLYPPDLFLQFSKCGI